MEHKENIPVPKQSSVLLVLLCGLPGSGKTTVANHFKQAFSSSEKKISNLVIPDYALKQKTELCYHHICYDSYLFDNLNSKNNKSMQFSSELWKESRKKAYNATESLIVHSIKQKMDDSDDTNKNSNYTLILIDDNMYYRSMRYQFYKLAKQYETAFLIVYLNTNTNECIRRNKLRNGMEFVNENVIERMIDKFQSPDCDNNKYKWEYQNCHTFDGHKIEELYGIIAQSWKNNVVCVRNNNNNELDLETINAKNKERQANLKNLKHQSDLKLRKQMSSWMIKIKEMNKNDKSNTNLSVIAKKINMFRKEILRDVDKCIVEDKQELDIMTDAFCNQFDDIVSEYCLFVQ